MNAAEIEAVGGSSGRAAVGFLGTNVNGDYQANSFPGKWYAYIATTYNGNDVTTWTTVNATPNDPVQSMTGIWQQGGGAQDRNLLDFNEITIDDKGRVLYGYSDGCVTTGCIAGAAANDFTANMRVARQSGGKTLLASYDGNTDTTVALQPKPPCLSGLRDGTGSHLTWKIPDNGGSPIVNYLIFRGLTAGSEVQIGQTGIPKNSFDDTSANPNVAHYFYEVKAVNSAGTPVSNFSNEIDLPISVVPIETPCAVPGVLAIVDNDGDAAPNTPPDPSVDIQQLFVAEPFFTPAADKLVFTMQLGSAASPPLSSQWYIVWNRQGTDPSDPGDTSYDRMFVAMKTDATGVVSFNYGKFGIPLQEVPPPPPDPNANTPKSYGAADSGNYDAVTGLVHITLSNSKLRTIDGGSGKHVCRNLISRAERPHLPGSAGCGAKVAE